MLRVLPDSEWRTLTDYKEKRGSAFAERVWKAVRLDPYFYSSVAKNPSRTREAVLVAALSSLIMGLGLMLMRIIAPLSWLLGAFAWTALLLLAGTWVLVGVGRRLGGGAEYPEMLRALGYAMAPQALGFVPIADFLPGFLIGGIWSVACAVVAVREAHGIPTRLAAALVIAPLFAVVSVVPLVVVFLEGGG